MSEKREHELPGGFDYEAPRIRDLEELGLSGQFPLGVNTCTPSGSGDQNTCPDGSGTGQDCNPTGPV
jgi:hypothetical protein